MPDPMEALVQAVQLRTRFLSEGILPSESETRRTTSEKRAAARKRADDRLAERESRG